MATRRPAHNTSFHMDLGAFPMKTIQEIRRVVDWSGGVAMWITHVGGKFRHGLLKMSLKEPKNPGDDKIGA